MASGIVVNVNARQHVDIAVVVRASSQVVTVDGVASTLETGSSECDQVLHTQQVVELPLNAARSVFSANDIAQYSPNTQKQLKLTWS
jgi:hypothetical protein